MGRARALASNGFTLIELLVVVAATSGLVLLSMLIIQKKDDYTKKLAANITPPTVTFNQIKKSLNSAYKIEKVGNILKIHVNRYHNSTFKTQVFTFYNLTVNKSDQNWSDLPVEYRKGRDSYQWIVRREHLSGKELIYWDIKNLAICWPAGMDCSYLGFNHPSNGSASRLLLRATPQIGRKIESIIYLDNYLDGETPRKNIKLIH